MNLKEISKKIYKFQKERFLKYNSKLTSELIFTHLVEEIGEIARQIFNNSSGMREYDKNNLKEEISQAILDLFVLAEIHEMDLENEINKKMKNMEGKWKE